MKKEMLFAKLHTLLMRIRHKLQKKRMTIEHKEALTREVDHWLQEFEVLAHSAQMHVHIPEETVKSIENMLNRVDEDLKEKVGHLETEMHGGQIYTFDEYKKVQDCAVIKSMKDELEKVIHLVQAEAV